MLFVSYLFLIPFARVAAEVRSMMEQSISGRKEGRIWLKERRSPKEQKLELQFFIKQQNVDKLYEELSRVANPQSKYYGQHLTKAQVDALTAPNTNDVQTVLNFIKTEAPGVPLKSSSNGDVIMATVSILQAEKMLECLYYQMKHHENNSKVIHRAPDGYSLPAQVAKVVDFVTPTIHLPPSPKQFIQTKESSTSNTPESLRSLYDIGHVVGQAGSNAMAVTAFLEQYYSSSALDLYYEEYCSDLVCGKGAPTLVGDATNGSAGVESMLDIETINGVAGNISSEFWGFSGRSSDNSQNEPFTTWLITLANTTNPPAIFSTSYGEDESSWSLSAADRLNQEFAEAGTRGISLLFASGDEGANCEDGNVFTPETPASSPYVTAVGGTTDRPEIAVSLSSGGFSNYWGRPDYQNYQVSQYLSNVSIPSGVSFNSSGRAVPDISAQAANFCVTPFGCGIAGTSCASPTAAAIFALLNDLRIQHGKSTLGFLNYFIYQNAQAFNDITSGSSSGSGLTGTGWPALSGWDAVTGVGTPSYANLATAALSLP